MATMNDVARLAKVSVSTVSYVLTGARPISQRTRDKVLAAMSELDYQPNAMARGLASRRSTRTRSSASRTSISSTPSSSRRLAS